MSPRSGTYRIRVYSGDTTMGLAVEDPATGKEVYRITVLSGTNGRAELAMTTPKGTMRLGAIDPIAGVWRPGAVKY